MSETVINKGKVKPKKDTKPVTPKTPNKKTKSKPKKK